MDIPLFYAPHDSIKIYNVIHPPPALMGKKDLAYPVSPNDSNLIDLVTSS